MSWSHNERLYQLLPAIHRVRDQAQGEPLRALLSVMETEFERLEADIEGLYENWFIETCDAWVIPYIADLLGVRLPHAIHAKSVSPQRAYVANTLRYRRRKGTPAVLEQLARDTTGWPARVVEFFQRLGTSPHLNHVRLDNQRTPNLRQTNALELVGTPFERVAHTVEVRHIASQRGRYNLPQLGLFVWRLQPYAVTQGAARAVADPADGRYTFHPLGMDQPLFNRPQTEPAIAHLAEEINTPGQLRRRALYDDLAAMRQAIAEGQPPQSHYFGSQPVFQIFVDGNPVAPTDLVISDLRDWQQPTASSAVAVDPTRGRLTLPAAATPTTVQVSYRYGFSSDVGGGPYDRQATLAPVATAAQFQATVSKQQAADHTTLAAALAGWAASAQLEGVITLLDSDTYAETLSLTMATGRSLVIQAANGHCPLVRITGGMPVADEWLIMGGDGNDTALMLNGLWLEGALHVQPESLERLRLWHCTLTPGRQRTGSGAAAQPDQPSVLVNGPALDFQLELERTITGPLALPANSDGLVARASVIDAMADERPAVAAEDGIQSGPPVTLAQVTVIGQLLARQFDLITESIVTGRMVAERRQIGCVRFSYLPMTSRTPQRYRCQPDLALAGMAAPTAQAQLSAALTPIFTARRYGHPAYLQLSDQCAVALRTGAEDGAEMGVFHHLQQPQRAANLRAALDEYLPFGLAAGILYVT
ncbi:MAG: hypothetical protein KF832_05015 [Caldilineaceae bacterium]|nr:hypothetical protein [Caldilineaceae bacterium]